MAATRWLLRFSSSSQSQPVDLGRTPRGEVDPIQPNRAPSGRPLHMRKRTRRKHFDSDAHPVRLALFASKLTEADDLCSLRTLELMSMAALDAGQATPADLLTLRRSCRISAELAAAGIGPEAAPLAQAALDALRRCGPGAEQVDREAVRQLLDVYDQQRLLTSWAGLDRAINRVVRGRVQ